MPVEMRRLTFFEAEVIHALKAFCERQEHHFPFREKILKLYLASEPGLKIEVMTADKRTLRTFTRMEVAASLVGYCRENSIPIPRAAAKRVSVHRNAICFDLRLHNKDPWIG